MTAQNEPTLDEPTLSELNLADGTEGTGNLPLGVALLSGGLLIFTAQDVIFRFLSGDYAVHQLLFMRCILACLLIGIYTYWRYGWAGFRIARPGILILRGLFGFTCFSAFYMALSQLSMALTVTIIFASPIVISLLSVLLLKEVVGWRRWLAIFVGFGGVVVVIGPSGSLLDFAVLLAVLATVTYALMSIVVRFLKDGMTGAGMAFYQMSVVFVAAGICGVLFGSGAYYDPEGHGSLQFMLRAWTMPTLYDTGLVAITSVISAVGFVMLTNAYAVAQPSAVASFEYTGVLWGMAAGWLFFGELPAGWTLLGAALIIGSGLYILARERAHGRIRPRASREVVAASADPPGIEATRAPEAERFLEAIGADGSDTPLPPKAETTKI